VASSTPLSSELLHRLNRLEYDNTVRELLGTSLTPASDFPPDSNLEGFDNLAEGLSLSPSLMGLYSSAARDLAEAALHVAPRYREYFEAKTLGKAPGYGYGASAFTLADSVLTAKLTLAQAEKVTLTVPAGGTVSNADRPIMSIQVDAAAPTTFKVEALPSAPKAFSVTAGLAAGPHTVTIKCDNYVNLPADNITNQLVVSSLEAKGEAQVVPASRAKIYSCEPTKAPDPEACYAAIVTGFAARAFRRPLTPGESESLLALWKNLRKKESEDEAVSLLVRAVLVSPNFLYRPSFKLAGALNADAHGLAPLDDYTIGSRLSYFLWSSMPDAALFEAAKAGALQTDAGLSSAVERMLADPRALALQESFAAQWLNARPLAQASRDPTKYPDFDEPLRAAMIDEVKQFFGAFLHTDLPVARMLDPGFGFVNDRLAKHYGLPLPGTDQVTRVTLPAGARGGILFQGAWLTASSEANRTSPVKRGRFLLERILCRSVPPPPPDVPAFKEPEGEVTMRERLAEHRKSPACAGCHNLLDPVGLGLEELDGIGSLRTVEAGAPIDTSGGVPADANAVSADVPYKGGLELIARLKDDPRFARCLTQKLYGYALGRNLDGGDQPYWEAVADAGASHQTLAQLVSAIALSPAFRRQTAVEVAP
jgi:Protein of unknown function (DUF1592)/Protein of unknown function (DUF1588)/Protein of unknown function (DUF1587)/Protein of unknown function (DUF1595)/Protein of unknown function (DUF1585)